MNSTLSLSASRSSFLFQVMSYTALAFAFTAVGAFVAPLILPANFPYMLLFVVELALVFTARWWMNSDRPFNILLFILFAFISGLTLFPLLAYATMAGGLPLVITALGATVCLSFSAGVYAMTTKRNLSGIGGFLMMILIGMILVGILQIFFFSSVVEMISAGVGVTLFSVFIAYDVQKLQYYPEDRAMEAAMSLYLDIFNLFTSILRFMIALNRD